MKAMAIIFTVAPLFAQGSHTPAQAQAGTHGQGAVKWEHTLKAAQARARAEKKVILMDLWAEWCGPCQYLKKKVFPTAEAQAALAKVVPFDALVQTRDMKDLPEGRVLAEKYELQGFPTLIIIDADGKELRRQVGAFENAADFAKWVVGK